MQNIKYHFFSAALTLLACAAPQAQTLDSVAVIVDQGVVLESEINKLLENVKRNAETSGQTLPSDRVLRTQAIERLILQQLQLQMAERMGIQISDPQLDQTINNMASQDGMTPEQLRYGLRQDGISYDDYREEVRRELITGEVRRANVRRRVYITPQEIESLITMMDEQGAAQIEYELGHILVGLDGDTQEDIDSAKRRADKVIEFLEEGKDFAQIAITASAGAKALDGGNMGWMNINAMPTLFADAVKNQKKDTLIGPIRSGAGFHILKVLDVRGLETAEITEVSARHILVKPSLILSEEKAEAMLNDIRDKVIAGEMDFAEQAKEHSEDPGSALKGGELGWADPSVYVPAFKDALAKLEKDQISPAFRSVHGWHITQLIERRVGDATEKLKQDRATQLLFNRKFAEESDAWMREMRDQAYVEVLEETE